MHTKMLVYISSPGPTSRLQLGTAAPDPEESEPAAPVALVIQSQGAECHEINNDEGDTRCITVKSIISLHLSPGKVQSVSKRLACRREGDFLGVKGDSVKSHNVFPFDYWV